jgi:WD40 repeat protein
MKIELRFILYLIGFTSPDFTLNGHSDGLGVFGVAFSSDHSFLASCSWDNNMNIWNATQDWSLSSQMSLTGECNAFIQLPDNQIAAGSGSDITIWSPLTHPEGPIRTLTGHSNYIYGLALSPDNKIEGNLVLLF